MSNKACIVYLAARGFEQDLLEELVLNGVRVREVRERLILADGLFPSAWAQNIWLEPFFSPSLRWAMPCAPSKPYRETGNCMPWIFTGVQRS